MPKRSLDIEDLDVRLWVRNVLVPAGMVGPYICLLLLILRPDIIVRAILLSVGGVAIVVLAVVLYLAERRNRAADRARRNKLKEELVAFLKHRDAMGLVQRWSHLHSIGCDTIMQEEHGILLESADSDALPVLREAIDKTPHTLQRWVDTSEVDTQSLSYPITGMIKELVHYDNPVRLAFLQALTKLEQRLGSAGVEATRK